MESTGEWLALAGDEPGDPFDRLERFLAHRGFRVAARASAPPVAEGVVADVSLGYRLATTLPGVREPQPPEPCPLPALACRIRPARPPAPLTQPRTAEIGAFRATWTARQHRDAVSAAREAIGRGDV